MRELTELASSEFLLKLARAGNMTALQALIARRNQAEETATLETVRAVLGREGLDRLFESIRNLTCKIAAVPRIGKTTLAKEQDELEFSQALADAQSNQD